MPLSNHGNRQPVVNLLKKNNANTILELGVGYGEFGKIVYNSIKDCKLFGIEIFKPYFEKIPKECYVQLFNEDMRFFDYDKISKEQQVNAVIVIDSLEHITREDGLELIKKLEKNFPLIIISVPIIDYVQHTMLGNEWEEHKTQWKIEELIELGYTLEFRNNIIGVFYKIR